MVSVYLVAMPAEDVSALEWMHLTFLEALYTRAESPAYQSMDAFLLHSSC